MELKQKYTYSHDIHNQFNIWNLLGILQLSLFVQKCVFATHFMHLCCSWLQCDAGEPCAVRKGARIGTLCSCPRGTSCNFYVLKCL